MSLWRSGSLTTRRASRIAASLGEADDQAITFPVYCRSSEAPPRTAE
jgi:hypothetical protein